MKLLTPRAHGFLDYLVDVAFLSAPFIFDYRGTPATIGWGLAAIHFVMTILTAFPLGIIKVIPFTVHGAIELLAALGLIAMPWVARFSHVEVARNFFVASGIAVLIVWAVTDYNAAPAPVRTHEPPSHRPPTPHYGTPA
jgi:hypothetical protein